jgi:hypothetical protein
VNSRYSRKGFVVSTRKIIYCKLNSERGVAISEFAIVLPFLILLVLASIDLGRAINQYRILSQIAHNGAQFASAFPGLAFADPHTLIDTGGCEAEIVTTPTPPTFMATSIAIEEEPDASHYIVQQNIAESLSKYSSDMPLEKICIRTAATDSNNDTNLDTVVIGLETNLRGFLPIFRDMTISVQTTSQYFGR